MGAVMDKVVMTTGIPLDDDVEVVMDRELYPGSKRYNKCEAGIYQTTFLTNHHLFPTG
jgi:hypothetical protein